MSFVVAVGATLLTACGDGGPPPPPPPPTATAEASAAAPTSAGTAAVAHPVPGAEPDPCVRLTEARVRAVFALSAETAVLHPESPSPRPRCRYTWEKPDAAAIRQRQVARTQAQVREMMRSARGGRPAQGLMDLIVDMEKEEASVSLNYAPPTATPAEARRHFDLARERLQQGIRAQVETARHEEELELQADTVDVAGIGDAAWWSPRLNQLAVLHGAETLFVGRLGDDEPGRTYRDRLVGHGVDVTRLVLEPDVPTGTALIMLNAERDNMIVVAPGANHRVDADQVAALDDLGPTDVLLMPMELPLDVTAAAITAAAGQGARVILNLAPYAALPQDVLDACFLIIVNEKENELMMGDGLRAPDVLVTLGTDGSRWGDLEVPAQKVDAVDTTGAGDAYCGALAAALVAGAGKREAMIAATASSAATVQHLGAQPDPPLD